MEVTCIVMNHVAEKAKVTVKKMQEKIDGLADIVSELEEDGNIDQSVINIEHYKKSTKEWQETINEFNPQESKCSSHGTDHKRSE